MRNGAYEFIRASDIALERVVLVELPGNKRLFYVLMHGCYTYFIGGKNEIYVTAMEWRAK